MAGVCRLSARFVLWGGAACLRKREVPSRIYRLLLPKKVALEPSSEYATATAATTTPTCRATTDGKNPSAYRCRSAVSPPMVLSVGVLPQWTEPAGVRTRRRERKKKKLSPRSGNSINLDCDLGRRSSPHAERSL